MNTKPPPIIYYKCPKCGLKESETRHLIRVGKGTFAKVHLCWFCDVKGHHVEMEKGK